MKKQLSLLSLLILSVIIVSCGDDDPPPKTETPESIVAINGDFYRGAMGSSLVTPLMSFEVQDGSGNALADQTVVFRTILGDGTIFADTVLTDSTGVARCVYTFSGTMGHAVIQAKAPGVDSVNIEVRTNTLIPGPSGHAYYILFDDTYGDVLDWLGAPERVDNDPNFWLNYAVYEDQLGVVVLIDDTNHDSQTQSTEAVLGVIVNTVYAGTTSDGIGIGSTLPSVQAIYGVVTGILELNPPPPAYRYNYPGAGLTFYTDTTANEALREVFEIHLNENISSPGTVSKDKPLSDNVINRGYRFSN